MYLRVHMCEYNNRSIAIFIIILEIIFLSILLACKKTQLSLLNILSENLYTRFNKIIRYYQTKSNREQFKFLRPHVNNNNPTTIVRPQYNNVIT